MFFFFAIFSRIFCLFLSFSFFVTVVVVMFFFVYAICFHDFFIWRFFLCDGHCNCNQQLAFLVAVRHSSSKWRSCPFLLEFVLLQIKIGLVFFVWELALPFLECEFLPSLLGSSLLGVWWLAFPSRGWGLGFPFWGEGWFSGSGQALARVSHGGGGLFLLGVGPREFVLLCCG